MITDLHGCGKGGRQKKLELDMVADMEVDKVTDMEADTKKERKKWLTWG